MGRPSDYNIELAKEICDIVREGKAVKHVLDSNKEYPSFPTWCRWVQTNQELRNLYYEAMRDKADAKEQEIEGFKDDLIAGKLDAHSAKVLLDVTRWQAGVYNSRVYGNKNGINVNDEEVTGISIVINKKGE
jgi:hypothetical protein